MELQGDVLISPKQEVSVLEGELVTTIRELASQLTSPTDHGLYHQVQSSGSRNARAPRGLATPALPSPNDHSPGSV